MAALPRRTPPLLLELDLTQPLIQVEPDDPVSKLRSRGKPRLKAVLAMLHEAGSDDTVAGLIAKIGGAPLPAAIADELRAGVQAFVASGKPAIAWSESYGESATGTIAYYLASAFSELWVQPSGELNLIGVSTEVTFLRGALDLLGVEPQIDKRHEYKNAADRITQTEFTPEHHEAANRLAESTWETVVAGIAESRGLPVDEVRSVADAAPLSASQALDARLVDRVGYRDEAYAAARRQAGGDVRLMYGNRWHAKVSPAKRAAAVVTSRSRPVVALVEGHGAIVVGRNRRSVMSGQQMGSDHLSAAFRAAREDRHVRAVVFRVDSPGGSYVASDTVWREVSLTRDAGKPVIVSMGEVAGSGGYFIACPADVIVAQPTTITGSIGVFGGKAVVTGLMDKVGLSTGAVAHGARARIYSTRVGYTDDERARLAEYLDEVYADFVGKVSDGRGMSRDAVHEIAKGRVWSGADAALNGLVDALGGVRDATRIARERANLPADAPVRRAVQVAPLAKLRAPRSSEDPRAVSLEPNGWGDLIGIAGSLGLPSAGPLTMPDLRIS